VLVLEDCEAECDPIMSEHMHDLRMASWSAQSYERACTWTTSSSSSVVHEVLCYKHMEEAEEKGGSVEVEVTMWVLKEHLGP